MTIFITGGHPTPAFALIEYLKTNQPDIKIIFIGRTTTRSSDSHPSPEQLWAKHYGVKFIPFVTPKFGFGFSFINIWRLLSLGGSTMRALFILLKFKPQAVVSFGSYLAVPVTLAGYLIGIKVITHEQTRGLGRANRLIARWAHTLALSHPVTEKVKTKRTVVTGNLLRPALFYQNLPPVWFPRHSTLPILYITGGEQGSEIINATVGQIIPQLVKNFIVIHQCGPANKKRNYLLELQKIKHALSPTMANRYIIKEWLSVSELSYLYHNRALILSRSGANTVDEIATFKLPSVLIPLPFSQDQEQWQNAMSLVESGSAILLEQKTLTPDSLLTALIQLKNSAHHMRQTFTTVHNNQMALDNFWQVINQTIKNNNEA